MVSLEKWVSFREKKKKLSVFLTLVLVVDDLLPVSREGTLMCTFSTNKGELWASIIEKAVKIINKKYFKANCVLIPII